MGLIVNVLCEWEPSFKRRKAKNNNISHCSINVNIINHQIIILVRKQDRETLKSHFRIKGNTTLSVNIPEEGNYYIYIVSADAAFDTTRINPMPYTFKAIFK